MSPASLPLPNRQISSEMPRAVGLTAFWAKTQNLLLTNDRHASYLTAGTYVTHGFRDSSRGLTQRRFGSHNMDELALRVGKNR